MTMTAKKRAKKKRPGFFGVTARIVMTVFAALLFLSYLSVVVNPASVWFFSIFGILFPALILINFFLLVWAIFRRSSSFWIPLLILLPAFFVIDRYWAFHTPSEEESELRMISYNVGRFEIERVEGELSKEDRRDFIFSKLRAEDADVICLQEFRVEAYEDVKAVCKRYFPRYECAYYAFPDAHSKVGNVTLSRYPILSKSFQTFEGSTNLILYTDVRLKQKNIRIYNCHLQSYSVSLPGLIKTVDEGEEYLRTTGAKMRNSILRRPRQVDEILKNIQKCPLESLVCGDFNDTPMSHTYFALQRGHKDSFAEAGNGFGASYYYFWPLLRIDYLLYGESLRAIAHKSPHWIYSDHYPVIVDFVWNKK